jgi:hypothetical protein
LDDFKQKHAQNFPKNGFQLGQFGGGGAGVCVWARKHWGYGLCVLPIRYPRKAPFGELDNPCEPWLGVCGSQVDACVTDCLDGRLPRMRALDTLLNNSLVSYCVRFAIPSEKARCSG